MDREDAEAGEYSVKEKGVPAFAAIAKSLR